MDEEKATALIEKRLAEMAKRASEFGSALPSYDKNECHELAICEVEEHVFGWVFFYNSKRYLETGEFSAALAGNAPIIVDRHDGRLYETGTAHPLEYYLEQHKNGNGSLLRH